MIIESWWAFKSTFSIHMKGEDNEQINVRSMIKFLSLVVVVGCCSRTVALLYNADNRFQRIADLFWVFLKLILIRQCINKLNIVLQWHLTFVHYKYDSVCLQLII